MDSNIPIDLQDVERAAELLLETQGLSARDPLHLAVMGHHGIHRIMSFDAGCDQIAGVARLH